MHAFNPHNNIPVCSLYSHHFTPCTELWPFHSCTQSWRIGAVTTTFFKQAGWKTSTWVMITKLTRLVKQNIYFVYCIIRWTKSYLLGGARALKTRCIFREFPLYTMYSVHCASRFRSPCGSMHHGLLTSPDDDMNGRIKTRKPCSSELKHIMSHSMPIKNLAWLIV